MLNDWIKINSYGLVHMVNKLATCEGVLQDNIGKLAIAFACNRGICSVMEVELWGMWHGLKIAWRLGYKNIILEPDSIVVIQMVTSPISNTHLLSQLVMNVQHLLNRNCIT